MASSMASFVPEPTEKCTVWAASPTSTTFPCDQRSFRIVGKLRQRDRFLRIGCPRSSSAKSRSVKATVSSSVASGSPARRHVSSVVSRMKVDRRSAYR